MEIQRGGSRNPTSDFRHLYQRFVAELTAIFPPEKSTDSPYPPSDAGEFVDRYVDSPDIHQHLSQELFTYILEIERQRGIVNKKKLWPHQKGQLLHGALTLPQGEESPDSMLIRGCPGIGKTLTLGGYLLAGTRMQMRGTLGEKDIIAYCTAKPFHMTQQIRGSKWSAGKILRSADGDRMTKMEIRELYKHANEYMPKVQELIHPSTWESLFDTPCNSRVEAVRRVERSLEKGEMSRIIAERDIEAREAIGLLADILCGQSTMLLGPDKLAEPLEMIPKGVAKGQQLAQYGGDAAWHLPKDYPVYTRDAWNIGPVEAVDPKVIFAPKNIFMNAHHQAKMEDILRRVRMVLCDEAGRTIPRSILGAVHRANSKNPPLVIAASAVDYKTPWQDRSPTHTLYEFIEKGVLPDIGVDVFPAAQDPHFPAESREAMEQFIEQHFANLPLPKHLKLKQPWQSNSLIIVHSKLTADMAMRLRREYDKRDKNAEVHCFDKASTRDKEKLQLWFCTDRKGPNVLVSSPTAAADALDLPTIENLTIGTNVSPDLLFRLLGRLQHSARDHRGYFRQQQFSDSAWSSTLFAALKHGVDLPLKDGFTWVRLQALMSSKAFKSDQKLIKKKKLLGALVPPMRKSDVVENRSGHLLVKRGGFDPTAPDLLKPFTNGKLRPHNGVDLSLEEFKEWAKYALTEKQAI